MEENAILPQSCLTMVFRIPKSGNIAFFIPVQSNSADVASLQVLKNKVCSILRLRDPLVILSQKIDAVITDQVLSDESRLIASSDPTFASSVNMLFMYQKPPVWKDSDLYNTIRRKLNNGTILSSSPLINIQDLSQFHCKINDSGCEMNDLKPKNSAYIITHVYMKLYINIILLLGAIIITSLMPLHCMTGIFITANLLMGIVIGGMAVLGVNFYDSHSRWHTSEHALCAASCLLKGFIIALTVLTSLICLNILNLNVTLYVIGICIAACALLTVFCDYKIPNNFDIEESFSL
jgi:hypothetical protein